MGNLATLIDLVHSYLKGNVSNSAVIKQGKMWRVIKGMYESSRSAVLLEGEKSEVFNVEQGVVPRM